MLWAKDIWWGVICDLNEKTTLVLDVRWGWQRYAKLKAECYLNYGGKIPIQKLRSSASQNASKIIEAGFKL